MSDFFYQNHTVQQYVMNFRGCYNNENNIDLYYVHNIKYIKTRGAGSTFSYLGKYYSLNKQLYRRFEMGARL